MGHTGYFRNYERYVRSRVDIKQIVRAAWAHPGWKQDDWEELVGSATECYLLQLRNTRRDLVRVVPVVQDARSGFAVAPSAAPQYAAFALHKLPVLVTGVKEAEELVDAPDGWYSLWEHNGQNGVMVGAFSPRTTVGRSRRLCWCR